MKKCSKCLADKSVENYSKCRSSKDGLQYTCKDCQKIKWKNYYSRDDKKEFLKIKAQNYYRDNKDKINNDKDKLKERSDKYRKNRPSERVVADNLRKRREHLYKKYGLTIEEYNEMFLSQSGRCSICNKESDKTLVVDHCHKTGKVRSLLCNKCNLTLGYVSDDTQILNKMINYLNLFNKEN